ncbi:hypothetical protein ACFOOK_26495 [Micromonospora krabiensis]|uniref:Uncharacterized protein n=1 Tax=Micromonospora krabiensis TaxID=307121 RepID=A0A1C3N5M3_9ACTN|nr:hypothetical protein [Micromonospora krabiensis]SBV27882.1 hypothetical protein GA0070620_3413 [Micromonospora krabiensis]
MSRRYDVSVNTNPVANQYAGPNTRIIEFSSPAGGGLISFFTPGDGTLRVDLYRLDGTVTVVTSVTAEVDMSERGTTAVPNSADQVS